MENKIRTNEEKNEMQFAVVGVTFENRQEILQQLYSQLMSNSSKIPVKLIPQPQNIYDKNAIAIKTMDNNTIGYVSKDFNEEIANIIPNIKLSYIDRIYMNKKRIFNAMIRLEF